MITQKNLFWDLGNTLLKIDAFSFARHMGLTDMVLYPLLERKHPKVLFDRALELLALIDVPKHGHCKATAQGKQLPPVVCEWLAGRISLENALAYLEKPLSEKAPDGFFSSKREARLVKALLKTLTDPQALASAMSMIKEGMALLKECSEQYDDQGNQLHTLFVLSNWDPYSFDDIFASPHLKVLFSYFDTSNLIISGDIGYIKPHKDIYSYVLTTYELNPSDCVLIDDQHENIIGAQENGMHGILLKNGNYRQVRNELRTYKIIR